jgi:MFS family permease
MQTSVPEKKMPLLNNWLLLFIFAMILANIGGNMYGPLLPLYLQKLNASVAQVGLFFTLSRIIPLVLQIVGGYISDSLGRLRAIAIGSVVGIFTYVALMLSSPNTLTRPTVDGFLPSRKRFSALSASSARCWAAGWWTNAISSLCSSSPGRSTSSPP